MLREMVFPERARVRIDACRASDRFMDARQPAVDLGHQLGIQGQVFARIGLSANGL